MSKQMLKIMLGLQTRINRLTKLIKENEERARKIAIRIEDMQGTLSARQASREESKERRLRQRRNTLRLGRKEANSK